MNAIKNKCKTIQGKKIWTNCSFHHWFFGGKFFQLFLISFSFLFFSSLLVVYLFYRIQKNKWTKLSTGSGLIIFMFGLQRKWGIFCELEWSFKFGILHRYPHAVVWKKWWKRLRSIYNSENERIRQRASPTIRPHNILRQTNKTKQSACECSFFSGYD